MFFTSNVAVTGCMNCTSPKSKMLFLTCNVCAEAKSGNASRSDRDSLFIYFNSFNIFNFILPHS